jgi:hypothetical protein
MEHFTTWTVTGIAAILALLVVNLQPVSAMIPAGALRVALYCLVGSLFLGVLSKQAGMALSQGLQMLASLEAELYSAEGKKLFHDLTTGDDQLAQYIAAPFWWPLSSLMRRSFVRAADDPLKGDRILVRLYCFQLYSNLFHVLLAGVALIVLASKLN